MTESDSRISFDVAHPGIPVIVRTTYFPGWHATNAAGPYPATPDYMIVIPHGDHVTLRFSLPGPVTAGYLVGLAGLAGLLWLLWLDLRTRRAPPSRHIPRTAASPRAPNRRAPASARRSAAASQSTTRPTSHTRPALTHAKKFEVCSSTRGDQTMTRVRVDYTHKRGNHYNVHERIQGIAGEGKTGWYRTETAAISDIKNDLNSFFVSVNGKSVDVVVATHQGREYLKTEADGYAPNNLLALPEPPARLVP